MSLLHDSDIYEQTIDEFQDSLSYLQDKLNLGK